MRDWVIGGGGTGEMSAGQQALPAHLVELLRCLHCGGPVRVAAVSEHPVYSDLGPDGYLACESCSQRYPLIAGTVRMLPEGMRAWLWSQYPEAAEVLRAAGVPHGQELAPERADVKRQTADSFAYEWQRFGALRDQWRKNFIDYLQPHEVDSLDGQLVLDVGTGSGRHAFQASGAGANVVAVDLGQSIDVARSNLPRDVLTVQADAELLPFAPASFDMVMSIGVLHHLPDPQRALGRIAPLARPGGHVHVYLYWVPEHGWHVRALRLVTAMRTVTVRMPHRLLHALCWPLAAILAVVFVWPYRMARRTPGLHRLADALPLKTYADYPFGVLVNDQFDRFSAPLERRYTRQEVQTMLRAGGLEQVVVIPNHGWIGDGRRPGPIAGSG